MENQVEEMELTPEELAERKEEMLRFYTESMPYLSAQLEYEKMLMQIDECRLKRTQFQIQYAMMMNPPAEDSNEGSQEALREELTNQQKERKLRKS